MSTFILTPGNARDRMKAAWAFACQFLQLGKSAKVKIEECKSTRSLEQNDKMWAMLADIAAQVPWHVDGRLQLIDKEDWKDILTAGLKKTQRVAAGIEGGFVMLGVRTSRMSIGQMVELIDFMEWFGSRPESRVVWSNSDEGRIERARAA